MDEVVQSLYLVCGIAFATLIAYVCLPDFRNRKKIYHSVLEATEEIESLAGSKFVKLLAVLNDQEDNIQYLLNLERTLSDRDVSSHEKIEKALSNYGSWFCWTQKLYEKKTDDKVFLFLAAILSSFVIVSSFEVVFNVTVFATPTGEQKLLFLRVVFALSVVSIVLPVFSGIVAWSNLEKFERDLSLRKKDIIASNSSYKKRNSLEKLQKDEAKYM